MNGFLRQSSASQTRTIGPFVDDTDFKTLKNALTIANTDIKIKKNGAASANKNSGGATADGSGGLYAVTWDATDSATVGELSVSVKVAGALVYFCVYTVLEEAVYDSLYAASALGYVVDQPVNTTKWAGTVTASNQNALKTSLAKGTDITGFNDLSAAQVNTEADTALSDIQLDHLFQVADPGGVVVNSSFWAKLHSKSATPAYTSYVNTTDSLEAQADTLGVAGAGLTAIGDTRMANLNATVSSRAIAGDAMALTSGERTTLAAAIWNVLTSTLTTANTIGKLLVDNINATITSRMATFTYTAPDNTTIAATNAIANKLDSALELDGAVYRYTTNALEQGPSGSGSSPATIADAVWDEILSGHLTPGSAGAALNGAGSAGDPWTTTLPGSYGAGTAGNILGNRLDAAVTSRMATFTYTAPDNTTITAINAKTTNLPASPAATGDAMALTTGERTTLTASIWNALLTGITTVGSIGKLIKDNLDAAISSRMATFTYTTPPTVVQIRTEMDTNSTKLDVAVGTRLATAGYTVPPTAVQNRTEMDSNSTQLAKLGTPSNLGTGANIAANLVDIENQTDDIGAAGAGLTSLPNPAGTLTTGERTAIADELLKRDMSLVSGEAARSPLNAFRAIRNKVSTIEIADTLVVKKEDDTTTAWSAPLTKDPTAAPITGWDPA